MFVLGKSLGCLNSIPPLAPAALGAVRLLQTRVASATARFAPPKPPQPLVYLVDVASLLARRVCCICTPMWELAVLGLTKPVWDGQSRVA